MNKNNLSVSVCICLYVNGEIVIFLLIILCVYLTGIQKKDVGDKRFFKFSHKVIDMKL